MKGGSAIGATFCVILTSCNTLLGIEDRPLRPEADAGVADDGLAPDAPLGTDAAEGGASAYASAVLFDAPLLYLRFGEHGGSIAHDEMHRFDGAYPSFGVTFAAPGALPADQDDGAVLLNGQSKIQMPASADFLALAEFSAEMWLKRDPGTPAFAFAIDHETWKTPQRGGWNVIAGSDGISFERYASQQDHLAIAAPTLAASEWHHLLFTWDGSRQRIFVDGTLAAEGGATSVSLPAVPEGWSIGGQNCPCSGNTYIGAIDELALYDHVLGGERVKAHLRAAGR